jgi:steroid delta-isomerase-like uncharacterized protein
MASVEGVIGRDLDQIVERAHPDDYLDDFVAIGEFRGREAVRGFFAEMFAAFPDFEFTVDRVVADDEAVAVKWHAEATFTGSRFQGIEATGRQVLIRGCDFFEVEDGWIRRNTVFYDGASFARQIGMLPPQGSGVEKALYGAFNGMNKLRTTIEDRIGGSKE